ncbi:MAG: 30S ribosome-binding factor RbfA [Alphaproteobacteria bacterium]|nr:30S ribosome-binding factor RbfA [Alphaproteobacteria bacterium]
MPRRKTPTTERGAGQRPLRVGEELRHALARLLERGVLRDPALAGLSITVTEVRVSPDLKNATAFVTPLGGVGGTEAVKALNHAGAHLRGLMATEVRLRYTPRLRFVLDTSFDNASRIERVLKEIAPGEDGHGA